MPRPRVFVTRRMAQEAIDLLRTELDVEVWPDDHAPPRDVLLQKTGECVALLTTVEDRIDEAVLAAGHGALKVVANCAVGFDNFDIQAATRLGVALSNTPGVLTKTTADLAFALILATARQVVQGDRDVRAGRWKSWHPFAYTGPDIHGATLGIIGLGQIGLEVARRAMGFEMTVLYYDPVRRPEAEETYGLTFCPDIPLALKEQLAVGGRLVGVLVRDGVGKATVIERLGSLFSTRELFEAATPILPGLTLNKGFSF